MRTNAPRMITVVLAVALIVIGLALTVFEVSGIEQMVMDMLTDNQLDYTTEQVGHAALLGSNLLLIVGALFKGV